MTTRDRFDHTGSTFDSFLEEEGILEEVEAAAIKAVIAAELQRAMKEQKISKSALARKLATSRAHVDRLLDPAYTPVSLETISRAATFMGKRLSFSLRDAHTARAPGGKHRAADSARQKLSA